MTGHARPSSQPAYTCVRYLLALFEQSAGAAVKRRIFYAAIDIGCKYILASCMVNTPRLSYR